MSVTCNVSKRSVVLLKLNDPWLSLFTYLKITSPPDDGATAEYLVSQITSVSLWGCSVDTPGKYFSQLCAKYRYTCHVLPKSDDRSINIFAGLNVLKRMMLWVKWNSASRSKRIVTFSTPFSACHQFLLLD